MNIEESWNKALRNTEIVRLRLQGLMTSTDTKVPYILLSESSINEGDTVVRKGEVIVHKPALFIPPHNPTFQGFDFSEKIGVDESMLVNFLLVRGVSLPSLSYDNKTYSLDVHENSLSQTIKFYQDLLQRQENMSTGLLTGPEDCWPLSLMIFICSQISKNSSTDIHKLLDEYRKNSGDNDAE